jgi:hypothetical protein
MGAIAAGFILLLFDARTTAVQVKSPAFDAASVKRNIAGNDNSARNLGAGGHLGT